MPTIRNLEILSEKAFAMRAPAYVDSKILTANTAATFTVPPLANFAVFSADANFYAAYIGGSANSPYSTTAVAAASTNISDGTGNELNPTIRFVGALMSDATREISGISVLSPSTCHIAVAYYKI